MKLSDYEEAFKLWSDTDGMGLRSLDDSKEGIKKFLDRNPTTNFCLRVEGNIVGLILSGHDGRRAYIYHAVVDSNYRGKGYGKMLLNKVINAMKKESINKIGLVVYKNNEIGNEFWNAQDFVLREDLNYRNKSINEFNI
jgi:ribosomal protein S18 acetylase RimI-like enzyme